MNKFGLALCLLMRNDDSDNDGDGDDDAYGDDESQFAIF